MVLSCCNCLDGLFIADCAKNLDLNWGLLSVSTGRGTQKLATKFSVKILAVPVVVVFAVQIGLISLD